MANRVFQGVVYQMKDTLGRAAGVVDENGTVVACTEPARTGEVHEEYPSAQLAAAGSDHFVVGPYTYHLFAGGRRDEYAVFVEGTDSAAARDANIVAISLQNILQYHDEKFDKSNFIKNIVLENILPGDIYAKARELHFATDVARVVLLIRVTNGNDISAFDVVSGLFPDKQKDFVFNVSETDTVLVKEIKRGIDEKDIEKLTASIVDTLNGEHYIKALVGIGTPISNIKDLAASFKEAQIALEVGKVFDAEQSIISYNHLGIARLIYQLPTTLCEMFLKEVFNHGSIDSLDDETLFTIQRFFENNLNVSETSRGLFVHRNTLVYRLEKIKKLTGLDLREFDDAIVFKVALMVKKYLTSNPAKY
ncbi:MAG: PucR family transcriptional regulator [Oscillospiraceae bacterium]